jgi:hypothetical protein
LRKTALGDILSDLPAPLRFGDDRAKCPNSFAGHRLRSRRQKASTPGMARRKLVEAINQEFHEIHTFI